MLTIAIAGFGTVGQGVAQLLLARPAAFRLTHICNRGIDRKRVAWAPGAVTWTERFEDLLASNVDVIVELIGGIEPARSWIGAALEAGKSVVTANKQVLALHGAELFALAARAGRTLAFEASVAGGVPVVTAIRDGLAGDRLTRIAGILNGTCNYILTRMESNRLAFDEALREAQANGFAEADPTDDVDGADARAKLCILARVGLGMALAPASVSCASIRQVTETDFVEARRLGCAIRQVSQVETREDVGVTAWVRPALVPTGSPLAQVTANQNLVLTTGLAGGEVGMFGYGAGAGPTSVAVLSDIIAIAERGHVPPPARLVTAETPKTVSDRVEARHYVRATLAEKHPRSTLVRALGTHEIVTEGSLRALDATDTSVAFVTAPTDSVLLAGAIASLSAEHLLAAPPFVMPIVE